MEVFDSSGKRIALLDPKKQKGINIVNWNYRMKSPKVAKGKTFSFGGFGSPRVPEGTYKVIMKKGKETFEHNLEVVYDPNSIIALEDRKLQEKTVMKLYNMTQELAYMVNQLDGINDYATKLSSSNSKLKKLSTPVISELATLKKGLVITTGDNYVGSAEPQLREKISDLYSVIIGNYDRPANTQLNNLTLLEERFSNAKTTFEKIKTKRLSKLQKVAKEMKAAPLKTKSLEAFLEE